MRNKTISALTVKDFQELIAQIVRKVIREEMSAEFYINEQGFRVRYEEEAIEPEYLAELQHHYQAVQRGRVKLLEGEKMVKELKKLGVKL